MSTPEVEVTPVVTPTPTPTQTPTPTPVTSTPNTTSTPNSPEEPNKGEAKPGGNSKNPSGNGPKADIGDLKTDTFNLGEQINNIQKAVFTTRGGRARAFKFQDDAYSVHEEDQDLIASLFVADQAHVADLQDRLSKKRVLVVSGESGIGKRTLAIYLASLIAAADFENGYERPQTYLVDPLDRHVNVQITKMLDGKEVPHDTFLILRDACQRGNPDLQNFVSQLNRFNLAEYSDKLRHNNSYLVLTLTTADFERLKLNLAEGDFQYRLNNLNRELLAAGLEKKLTHLEQGLETAGKHLEVMRGKQNYLIDSLKNMPRLAGFIDYYAMASAANGEPLDLDEALRRFDDVGYWFKKNLSKDFEEWSFTLSLGLAHCLGDTQDVSWFGFEYLRRSVFAWLKGDEQLFPEEPEQNKTNGSGLKERKLRLLDDEYLDACRAEIVKDNNSLSDLIVFRSRNYPGRLWEVMLQHYRSILSLLLPHLLETAENGGPRNDVAHRVLCARLIGRIGEIDPDRITRELMDRWMASDEITHQALMGALYEGILASKSERYRTSFLDRLKGLTNSQSKDEVEEESGNSNDVVVLVEEAEESEDKKAEKKLMLALTAVYAQIGDQHFELSMRGLERIAENKLVRVIEDFQRLGRLIERTQNAFQQRLSREEAEEVLPIFQEMVTDVIERLFNPQRYTFAGVQFAFWSLCLSKDPISVFAELRRWIKTSNQATGALVALMFLSDEGIATHLESQKVEIESGETGSSQRHWCNEILASLRSDQATRELALFLVTLYESFTVPFVIPSGLMQVLQESLVLRLKIWAEEALTIETCRHATVKLFVELMRVHQGKLFDLVYRLLHDKKFGKKHPELKKSFVDAVLWQSS